MDSCPPSRCCQRCGKGPLSWGLRRGIYQKLTKAGIDARRLTLCMDCADGLIFVSTEITKRLRTSLRMNPKMHTFLEVARRNAVRRSKQKATVESSTYHHFHLGKPRQGA
jgi:hypothetical protein